jgi:hypothetical protein
LYQFFLATRLVVSQAELEKAAANYRPAYIDLDKMYRLAMFLPSPTLANSVREEVPMHQSAEVSDYESTDENDDLTVEP